MDQQMMEMIKLYDNIRSTETKITVANAIIKRYQHLSTITPPNELPTMEQPTSTLNPDGKSRKCECGAKHTSYPNHHLNYCPMKKW